MLGKLMKYEFKATWKLIIPMDLFLLLMSIITYGMVQLSFFNSKNELVIMTGMIIIMTYALSMFVIAIGTIIYLIYRFYTSVYGDEGYLLHTLPVDKHHIIISKGLTSAIWVISNILLIYLSVLFLFSTNKEFVETIRDGFSYYMDIINTYSKINTFSIVMTLIASFVTLFARILKISACISLGQLSSNHKVLVSFGFYYAIHFVQKIFSLIYFTVISLSEYTSNSFSSSMFTRNNWAFSLISGLIYCVVFYFLTWYVMDKKLNLD